MKTLKNPSQAHWMMGAACVIALALPSGRVGAQTNPGERTVNPPVARQNVVYGYASGAQEERTTRGNKADFAPASATPFLYLQGSLGGQWTVDGFGASGSNVESSVITIQHNETLGLDFDGFGPLTKVSGSPTGATTMDWQLGINVRGGLSMALLPGSTGGLVTPATVNTMFTPSSPLYAPAVTGGVLRIEIQRKLLVAADNTPGRYQNDGSLTLYRY
ncbi:MAG: hypothetical protein KIS66_15240 [Fimbriimonadaceae bacterium]|nr:hypothetical protein [Fimbriimonadaceae bacterium]